MSSTSRAWFVAASVGAVEALKDHGFGRWNHAFRSFHQHAKHNLGSFSQARKLPPPPSYSSTTVGGAGLGGDKAKQSEESLRKVMYLSCWGPN